MRAILLAEDHAESRTSLAYLLSKRGFLVHQAANGRAALAIARREELHGLILDLKLPDMDGLAVLDAVMEQRPGLPAIVVTGFGTIDAAVDAMKRGASDFMTKPLQLEQLLRALERSIERAGARGSISTPPSQAAAEMERLGIIGCSEAMRALFDTLKRIAPHSSNLLVLGESGTGKELLARAFHALGARAGGPFVAVNCATLSEAILENELFGHERGAFTSADQPKPGVMELADHGTLFLDDASEMGLGCQAKLLRALERLEFRRLGGTRKIQVDVNLVAASNVDLEQRVASGAFRADLFYRLKVVTITIPPLRERKEAIPVLAERFLEDASVHAGVPARRLTPDAVLKLCRYTWPGNVRELKNCMESLTLTAARPLLDAADLPANVRGAAPPEVRFQAGMKLEDVEREVIRLNLEAYPTIKDAARALGIPLRTFHDRLKRYGLQKSR